MSPAARIIGAFPAALAEPARRVADAMTHTHDPSQRDIGPVAVHGERLSIPYRIYPTAAHVDRAVPSSTERTIARAILTRHHDGFVRQGAAERLLDAPPEWVAPFLVQLLGEYVLEIARMLADERARWLTDDVRAFARENPELLRLTAARATSYWDCYWRRAFPARLEYPAFDVLRELGVR